MFPFLALSTRAVKFLHMNTAAFAPTLRPAFPFCYAAVGGAGVAAGEGVGGRESVGGVGRWKAGIY